MKSTRFYTVYNKAGSAGRDALHTWSSNPVATVIEMIAEGMSYEEILKAYPDLETEDLKEAHYFAAGTVRERELSFAR